MNVPEISAAVTSDYWVQISILEHGDGYLSQLECGEDQRLRCPRADSLPRAMILPHVRGIIWSLSRILSISKTLGLISQ